MRRFIYLFFVVALLGLLATNKKQKENRKFVVKAHLNISIQNKCYTITITNAIHYHYQGHRLNRDKHRNANEFLFITCAQAIGRGHE